MPRSHTHLVIFVLQLGLRTLAARPDGLGIVPVEGARGLGMVQLWPVLVDPRNQQGNAEGPAHDGLLAVGRLAEAQGQVADCLRARLDAQPLVVVELVALALDARVLDHGACIGLQAAHGAPDVPVDLDNLLYAVRLEERRRHALLDPQHDALAGRHADGRRAQLDGFERVLNLEEAPFWGEGAGGRVRGAMVSRRLRGREQAECGRCAMCEPGAAGIPGWSLRTLSPDLVGSVSLVTCRMALSPDPACPAAELTIFRSCHKHVGGICAERPQTSLLVFQEAN